jgi:hypothetical protein
MVGRVVLVEEEATGLEAGVEETAVLDLAVLEAAAEEAAAEDVPVFWQPTKAAAANAAKATHAKERFCIKKHLPVLYRFLFPNTGKIGSAFNHSPKMIPVKTFFYENE